MPAPIARVEQGPNVTPTREVRTPVSPFLRTLMIPVAVTSLALGASACSHDSDDDKAR